MIRAILLALILTHLTVSRYLVKTSGHIVLELEKVEK